MITLPPMTGRRHGSWAALVELAPDHIGGRANLDIGAGRTIEAPGTTQAFRRSTTVTVRLEDTIARIRRPSLVAALLGKIAAATKITSQTTAERTKHLRDADALAKLLGPDDRNNAELSPADVVLDCIRTGFSDLAARTHRRSGYSPTPGEDNGGAASGCQTSGTLPSTDSRRTISRKVSSHGESSR